MRRQTSAALAFAFTVCLTPAARAEEPKERLLRLSSAAHGAYPTGYVALREIWGEWDQDDPTGVEAALSRLHADRTLAPSLRVYSGLLEAYARRRRGDLDGARTRVAKLGFVGKWLSVGPFDNEGKSGLNTTFEPEHEQSVPITFTRSYDGKDHHPVRWRPLKEVSPYGWTDFGAFVRPSENVCVYATTFVQDLAATKVGRTRPISLWAGGAGAMRLFWNGREVLHEDKYRGLDADRYAAEVDLAPGENRLLVKVCGAETAPMITLRVANKDGAPDPSIEVDADPRHSTRQGGAAEKGIPRAGAGRLEGPMQAFERLGKGANADLFENFARYLRMTAADDPSEHRARELARKAADLSPSVRRFLLAADVAENRDQEEVWIAKAEALAEKPGTSVEDRKATLLARAAHIRTGFNARDSIPFYDRVEKLDPYDIASTLARVELYEDAELRASAVEQIERLLAVRPRSVALLRAHVAALRAQARTTEADEAAERYAAFRFDDPTFIREHIDLAVARKETATAERWIARYLATNPDSQGAYTTAAQAYISLGSPAHAVTIYRHALELAPDDTDILRGLATVYGLLGEHDEQVSILKRVLELMPQAKEVREYLAHAEKEKPKADEAFARPKEEFLKWQTSPSKGEAKRTLVDLAVSTVFPNGLASRFKQVVFQPLTDAAAAGSREYDFNYEDDAQAVQMRAARVYRKNGQIDEAIESGPGQMADDPSVSMYTSARTYYVRFPRLEPGDIVELQYRIEGIAERNAFADYFGEVAYLQSNETVAHAEYDLITPKSRTFYFNEPRVPGLVRTTEERGDERIYRFVAKDVQALKAEELQPPWTELLGHVHVSTYASWEEMGRWYWGLIKDQLVADDELRRRARELTAKLQSDREKAEAIYAYVVQRTRYVALEFGIHGFKPYRSAQVFARGFGDCKDKAGLLVTMLREVGIAATPVVVRTGMRGEFETEPASLAPFDHMIAYVPSLDLYLDGTAEFTGTRELPAMDRGALALQVNEGHAKLVHLPSPDASESVISAKMDATIQSDGTADLEWRTDVSGVDASSWRQRFHAPSTRKIRVEQLLGAAFPGGRVKSVSASVLDDLEHPVWVTAHATVPHFAEKDGGQLSVPAGPREHLVREFAPLASRQHAIRLFANRTERSEWDIKVPHSAHVVSAPKPFHLESPFGKADVVVEKSAAGSFHVVTTITFTETRIPPAQYEAFHAFCESVDRALGQRLTVTLL